MPRYKTQIASPIAENLVRKVLRPGLVLFLMMAGAIRAGELRVEHSVITRQARADNGTIHVYVRNVADRELHVSNLSLFTGTDARESLLKTVEASPGADGEEGPYLWWRSFPDPIPPGAFADLQVKLTVPPARKLSVRFTGPAGVEVKETLEQLNDALGICSVGFSPALDAAFVYVENRLRDPVRLHRVLLNGQDVTRQARLLADTIPPSGKGAVIIPRPGSFRPGEVLFLKVIGNPSAVGATLVRAFSRFPITWMDGKVPADLQDTDGVEPVRPGSVPNEGLAGIEHIMRCPAHAHGTRPQAAARFIELHRQLVRNEPAIPGMIFVCRWDKEKNYFVFCELGDFTRVMPWAGSSGYVEQPLNHRAQWLTALAVTAAAPHPVHAVVPIRFEDSYQWKRSCSPEEIRALVYLPLSRGAKGLSYGKSEPTLNADAEAELSRVTREVGELRPYLAFAEPMDLGRTTHPAVEAATLLAGDRALVLLLINHSFKDFDNDRILRCEAQHHVRCEITLPDRLSVESVQDVGNRMGKASWRQDQHLLKLDADCPGVVRAYLVTFRSADRAGARLNSP